MPFVSSSSTRCTVRLRERLDGYLDQNLVPNLLEGIRLEADVELQTVLVCRT